MPTAGDPRPCKTPQFVSVGHRVVPAFAAFWVSVQFLWFGGSGSEECGERTAGLVGGVEVAEVGEQAAVL